MYKTWVKMRATSHFYTLSVTSKMQKSSHVHKTLHVPSCRLWRGKYLEVWGFLRKQACIDKEEMLIKGCTLITAAALWKTSKTKRRFVRDASMPVQVIMSAIFNLRHFILLRGSWNVCERQVTYSFRTMSDKMLSIHSELSIKKV